MPNCDSAFSVRTKGSNGSLILVVLLMLQLLLLLHYEYTHIRRIELYAIEYEYEYEYIIEYSRALLSVIISAASAIVIRSWQASGVGYRIRYLFICIWYRLSIDATAVQRRNEFLMTRRDATRRSPTVKKLTVPLYTKTRSSLILIRIDLRRMQNV